MTNNEHENGHSIEQYPSNEGKELVIYSPQEAYVGQAVNTVVVQRRGKNGRFMPRDPNAPPAQPQQLGFDFPGVELSDVALRLPDNLPWNEYEHLFRVLIRTEGVIQFALGDMLIFGEAKYGEQFSQVLDGVKVKMGTLTDYRWVAGTFTPEQRDERLSYWHFRACASLMRENPEQALDLLRRAAEADPVWTVRELQQQVTWAKHNNERGRRLETPRIEDLITHKRYGVIYADPPWEYDEPRATTADRNIESHYPTMSIEDIASMKVEQIALEDSMLFLWVPPALIDKGLDVMKAWGFKYRTQMVWVKDKIGAGHYVRSKHEILLIGKRGDIPTPLDDDRPDSVIFAPRGEHSAKPPEFAERIEHMYPHEDKIELFARSTREGWDAFGDEVGVLVSEAETGADGRSRSNSTANTRDARAQHERSERDDHDFNTDAANALDILAGRLSDFEDDELDADAEEAERADFGTELNEDEDEDGETDADSTGTEDAESDTGE